MANIRFEMLLILLIHNFIIQILWPESEIAFFNKFSNKQFLDKSDHFSKSFLLHSLYQKKKKTVNNNLI